MTSTFTTRQDFGTALALQDVGEIPDPREAQIARLKTENSKLRERLAASEQTVTELAAQHEEIVRLREAAAGPPKSGAFQHHEPQ
ncbi:hypothetical protein ACFXOD_36750 [Streptomyces sp. NPDC059161]|uniref:hypothetical protein n=1 Tax=Streptomyces sp. NPDC059161 TaxID=3346749 RepID=UPI0036CF3EED